MATEILPRLFVGNQQDANEEFEGDIINVLEEPYVQEPNWKLGKGQTWANLPVLDNSFSTSPVRLNHIADEIHHKHRWQHKVLVHCREGVERAPLAVVWYLHRRFNMTLEDAYRFVMAKRPQVQDRRLWIKY